MELHEWLDKPENHGKAVWLADQLQRSKTAVSLWREDGVPLPLMPRIAELCDGVTVQAMLTHALACKTRSTARTAA
jgi:hypothetical protein